MTRLDKYYLGKTHDLDLNGGDQNEYEQILTNLFADAVEVGAIILPSPYVAEDFEFKVNQNKSDDLDAIVTLRGNPQHEGEGRISELEYFLPIYKTLRSRPSANALNNIAGAITDVLQH